MIVDLPKTIWDSVRLQLHVRLKELSQTDRELCNLESARIIEAIAAIECALACEALT